MGSAALRLVGHGLEGRKTSIMIMTDHRRVSPRNTHIVMEFIHAIRRPTSPPGDYYDSGRLKVRIYNGKHSGSEHKHPV